MAQVAYSGLEANRSNVDTSRGWCRSRRRVVSLLAALILSLAVPGTAASFVPPVVAAAAAAGVTTDSWPMYLHDDARTGASADTTLSIANVAQLTRLWSYATGGTIAAQPAIVNGVVYVGSWDGYEYALNAATGALIWKTYLGTTTANSYCFPSQMGVSSSAAVANGVVYVGGGDAYWYALDAATGTVLWRVYTGDNSASGGHYNWSSPLIYNGYAYIGIASVGDCPLVQGQLLQVDLGTHQIVNTFNVVPNGQVGGGIWSSPSVDPATNTLYVTTGTLNDPSQTFSQAIIALNASTLAVTSYWQIPQQQTVLDSDWGNTPILFSDEHGRQLVAATNKNGYVYAFLRGSVGSGPVWQQQIAIGGECPACGDGSAASMAFGNDLLYVAGGNTTIGGAGHPGSVRALDPATGNVVWEHADPAPVLPALTYDNGLVIAAPGPSVEVLDASSGSRLYSFTTGGALYGPAAIANGTLYFGSGDQNVYALALPSTSPPPPADPQCPSGWTCQDIGSPAPAGSETSSGASWTIVAGGSGVTGTSDQVRYLWQSSTGDTQITAQVQNVANSASGAQIGVMVRQNADPGAPYYAVLVGPDNTVVVQERTAFGGATTTLGTLASATLPLYLAIQRTGDTFQAATSLDGTTYRLIPGTTASLVMPFAAMYGVAASSGANGTSGSATVSAAAIAAPAITLDPAPSAAPCPSGWSCADVGNPALVGNQTLSGGVWTISGAGQGIAGYGDQLRFVWQSLPGDGTLSARITSQSSAGPGAAAGVMLRQNGSAGAAFYAAFVSPGQGVVVEYRPVQGLRAMVRLTYAATPPVYLEVARSGSSFSTYSSTDGVTWTYVVGTGILMNLNGPMLAGLAVSSATGGAASSATFDSVALGTTAPPPPVACPSGWSCADIGNPLPPGDESLENGVWSIEGAGSDIWNTADQFHFDWQSMPGDGAISVHVLSQSNTSPWAKAGLMVRASTSSTDAFYDVMVTPGSGIVVQYRATAEAYAQSAAAISGSAPIYLRIGRSGTTFSAYTSSDGANWTPIAGSAISLPSLSGALLAGMAVTSHAGGTLGLASLDNATFSTCPGGWSCQDIGGPSLAGTETASGGTWTVQGSGSDIWGTADQFHFDAQTLAADGTLSVHIVSQTNSDPWAKAGLMVRGDWSAGAPFYDVVVTPGSGVAVQYRSAQGVSAQMAAQISGTSPIYLRVGRSGTTFSAYMSADGVTWTLIPGSTLALPNLAGILLAGLAITAHNSGALSTVAFDSISFSTCSPGWTCADIGGATPSGSQTASAGTAWTLQGGGNDIWGTSDQFHFAWQALAADGSVRAHISSQTNTDAWAKAGVMLRLTSDPGAPYYAVYITPANGLAVQYRSAQGASAQQAALIFGAVPTYLEVARAGSVFTAFTSADGITWTPIAGSSEMLSNLAGTLLAGLAVTAHNGGQLSAVAFDGAAVSTCPGGWTCQDIGTPAIAGGQTTSSGAWTVQGSGGDIWGTSDQFHFAWQTLAADGSVTAHVDSQTNTSGWAKGGVMLRLSSDPGAPYYAALVTPANGIAIQMRTAQGATTQQVAITGTVPTYLRVSRTGTTFTAYTSSDGLTWNVVPGSTLTIGSLSGTLLAGIAVTAHNADALSQVTLDSVLVSTNAAPPPTICPAGWSCADIGYTLPAGSQSLSNGIWTIQGAGGDIWGTSDQFHFVWQTLSGDGSVGAHVASQANTNGWAKAGVMLRLSTDPGAPFYAVYLTPANGVAVQYRSAGGASAQMAAQIAGSAPFYLKVTRAGTTFSAYTSSDGVTWTLIPGSTLTLSNLSGTLLGGMAVTAHNAGTLCAATFDSVAIG